MKKITAIFLGLIFAFSLFGCGAIPEDTGSSRQTDSGILSSDWSTDTQSETDFSSEPSSDAEIETDDGSDGSSDSASRTASTDSSTDLQETTDSSDSATDSDGVTDTDQAVPPTEEEPPVYEVYEQTLEHKVIATDIVNFSLVVLDLDLCKKDFEKLPDEEAVIWEWKPKEDPNCRYANNILQSISGVKFRYSEHFKGDVVIACANFGWVGVIDYKTCRLLWECELPYGPHTVEMLPNGDLVVGSAHGEGALYYIPLSAGATNVTRSAVSPGCHGACWDPENEWLWVLEKDGVYAYQIENLGTMGGEPVRVEGHGADFSGDSGGHAFAPIAGEPGKYWVSAGKLWVFDSQTETLTAPSRTDLGVWAIKGICSFSDGTVVEAIAGLCKNNTYSWGSDGLRIIIREYAAEAGWAPKDRVIVVPFPQREFYKVQAFSKKYQ